MAPHKMSRQYGRAAFAAGHMHVACMLGFMLLGSASAHAASQSGGLGPSRIDFDDKLIRGQRPNSGGIYIFARQSVALQDMVQKPKSYRQRIILTVFED